MDTHPTTQREMAPEPRALVQEQAEKKIADLETEAKEPCAD